MANSSSHHHSDNALPPAASSTSNTPPHRPIPSLVPISFVDFVNGRLQFSDGWYYNFETPGLLREAMTVRGLVQGARYPNQKLAIHGDKALETLLSGVFVDQDHSTDEWQRLCGNGMRTNAYLAHVAKKSGILEYVQPEGEGGTMDTWDQATVVEAVFGAVFRDSQSVTFLKQVMLRFDVWWPESASELEFLHAKIKEMREAHILGREQSKWEHE
ncbi:hypothetical protein AC578_3816 [Pseudocercospora eumusae]|uniref:RNase III domain-containing protein n=1 Tax=Pseudocercospora eumusae TaxID=321146 RepID=A0A139HFK6_9PEZI|nr:hypothetical protein AC578_3816 [Pseudocercospora eumusae]